MAEYDIEKFFNLSIDMLCIAGTDGYLKRVNPAFTNILGWSEEELLNRPFFDFIHSDDIAETKKEIQQLADGIPTHSFENRYRCADGTYTYLRWTSYPETETGLLFCVARNVTLQRRSQDRFRLAMKASPTAMVMVNEQKTIELVNHATELLFGYSPNELINQPVTMLMPERYREGHNSFCSSFFNAPSARPMGMNRDLTGCRKDGFEFSIEVGLNPFSLEEGTFVLCSIVDLTERKKAEQKIVEQARKLEEVNTRLLELATTDSLTQLKNRGVMLDQLEREILFSRRTGLPLSFLMIDVDHFKQYNDNYGHPAGDDILRNLAHILQEHSRQSDIVVRYGGEEFAVIMPATDYEGSLMHAERIRAGIEQHRWPNRQVTASLGAATVVLSKADRTAPDRIISSLISEADKALYHSKQHGRNRVTHARDR